MDFTIDVRDFDRLRDSFEVFSDRRFAAGFATGLTRTVQAVQGDERREIDDVFDRPTEFARRQVYIETASAARLQAEVGVSDAPFTEGFLKPHIFGGGRRRKRFERLLISSGAMPDDMFAVPGKFARLDAYGNLSRGQIGQILSQLRIEPTSGRTSILPRLDARERAAVAKGKAQGLRGLSNAERSDRVGGLAKQRRINAAYRRAGGQYVAFPYGRGRNLLPGIYLIRRTWFGSADPKPVVIFVSHVNYEAERFDFFYVARKGIERHLPPELDAAMADQLRRWRAKYGGGKR